MIWLLDLLYYNQQITDASTVGIEYIYSYRTVYETYREPCCDGTNIISEAKFSPAGIRPSSNRAPLPFSQGQVPL